MIGKVSCFAVGAIMLGSASLAQADIIDVVNNGDFEDGYNGWTVQRLSSIAEIDIDGVAGGLTTSYAGSASVTSTYPGEISQDVMLTEGIEYLFEVDLMASTSWGGNADAGLFTAAIGGETIGSFDFGSIGWYERKYGSITTSFIANSTGMYTLSLAITRKYTSSNVRQYFDNISLTYDDGNSSGAAPVPEPATMLLFGTGLMGFVGSKARKKRK